MGVKKDTIEDVTRKIKEKCSYRPYLNNEMIEDITQEILTKWFVHKKNLNQAIDFAITDYVRHYYGKPNTKFQRGNPFSNKDITLFENILSDPSKVPKGDIHYLIKDLAPIDKAMINLRFIWGYSCDEIAVIFDIDYYSVCVALGNCYKLIKENYANYEK